MNSLLFQLPNANAASELANAINQAQAVVHVEAIEAAVFADKPQGVIDKNTGQVLIVTPMRRMAATQDGSGIIIDKSGIIVTNTHTVKDAPNLYVTLYNGARVRAKLLHHVPDQDISFIAINPPVPLNPISFANSDMLQPGMSVYSIGHSQWVNGTVSGGVVRFLGTSPINGETHITLLQMDFRSYKGDSGSPILDGNGRLVGMITAGQIRGNITVAISSALIVTSYQNFLRQKN